MPIEHVVCERAIMISSFSDERSKRWYLLIRVVVNCEFALPVWCQSCSSSFGLIHLTCLGLVKSLRIYALDPSADCAIQVDSLYRNAGRCFSSFAIGIVCRTQADDDCYLNRYRKREEPAHSQSAVVGDHLASG